MSLLRQTNEHLKSADATYLIEKGVTAMTKKLLEALRENSYSGSEIGLILAEPHLAEDTTRRLVDCLPAIDRWGKGIWEGVPDSGIEVGHHNRQTRNLR
jgi:peroxin-3